MNLPSWIDSHIRTFEFLGGVPQIVAPTTRNAPSSNPTDTSRI